MIDQVCNVVLSDNKWRNVYVPELRWYEHSDHSNATTDNSFKNLCQLKFSFSYSLIKQKNFFKENFWNIIDKFYLQHKIIQLYYFFKFSKSRHSYSIIVNYIFEKKI